jgi:hypothetical protein
MMSNIVEHIFLQKMHQLFSGRDRDGQRQSQCSQPSSQIILCNEYALKWKRYCGTIIICCCRFEENPGVILQPVILSP